MLKVFTYVKYMKRKKGFFSISAVAEMFSVHQQTIRLYEKEGLISPKRSEGNTRLFSEEDVDRLEEVIYLTHQLGINLAGVEMILKLKKQIRKMQKDMNKVFDETQKELEKETEISQLATKATVAKLYKIKQENQGNPDYSKLLPTHDNESQSDESGSWKIDYDND